MIFSNLGLKKIHLSLLLVLLGGCAVQPESNGYDGPIADINDTFRVLNENKLEFFYVEKIDGHSVRNARETSMLGYNGFGFTPVSAGRLVPAAKPITLTLVGRTQYRTSLQQVMGSVYLVRGDVTVTLDPNQRYSVKGRLSESSASVWLQNDLTHERVVLVEK